MLLLASSPLQVRTVLGKQGSSVKRYSIAFLDPRSPAHIMMADPRDTAKLISCFEYNAWKYPGIEGELACDAAGQPLLPCIGVQLRSSKQGAASSAASCLEDCFISYPVEVCWWASCMVAYVCIVRSCAQLLQQLHCECVLIRWLDKPLAPK
jgi:hypothetical protein